MKTLKLESVLNAVTVVLIVSMITLIIVNISTYGIYNSASFEF